MKNFNALTKTILGLGLISISVFSSCKKSDDEKNDPNNPNAPYEVPLNKNTVYERLSGETLKLSGIFNTSDQSLITYYPKDEPTKISSCVLGEKLTFNQDSSMPRTNSTACDDNDKSQTMLSWSVSSDGNTLSIVKNGTKEDYKIVELVKDDKKKNLQLKLQITDPSGKVIVKRYNKIY